MIIRANLGIEYEIISYLCYKNSRLYIGNIKGITVFKLDYCQDLHQFADNSCVTSKTKFVDEILFTDQTKCRICKMDSNFRRHIFVGSVISGALG